MALGSRLEAGEIFTLPTASDQQLARIPHGRGAFCSSIPCWNLAVRPRSDPERPQLAASRRSACWRHSASRWKCGLGTAVASMTGREHGRVLSELAKEMSSRFKRRTIGNRALELPSQSQHAALLPGTLCFAVFFPYLKHPAAAVHILRILPQRLHTSSEEVYRFFGFDAGPRGVIEDAVERSNVLDFG